jgi:hypothetical protein
MKKDQIVPEGQGNKTDIGMGIFEMPPVASPGQVRGFKPLPA